MANEISRNTRITWSKNGAQIIASIAETMDQVGNAVIEQVQNIGATSETIEFGEVSGACHLMFKNMEPEWSDLTADEKAAYTGDTTAAKRLDYETKHSVYVSPVNPAVKTDPEAVKVVPGSGHSVTTTVTPVYYAIRDTNSADLLVAAIEV